MLLQTERKWIEKLNLASGGEKKKVHFCFAYQGQCTHVCIILSCCWQALESEFHIKKGRWFDFDRENWSKQHITAQCQSSLLVLTAHGHPMTMYKQGESEWAFHLQTRFTEGQNSWKKESQEQSNWACRCSMNTARVAERSMSRRLWLWAVKRMES